MAVVTGGGAGMGRELVVRLAAEGCSVAACDIDEAAFTMLSVEWSSVSSVSRRFETVPSDVSAGVVSSADARCRRPPR
ncbi:SDR family NAD(P)-dependent oxidoreductase [Nonomuraea sp. SBT364]|uniref:SDR family NAD(P)-dependent oxidoreductase n=1 Tax=Nonomuraea sp. SBT364 TaxID=1580530 RepID=UPI003FA54B60